MRSLSCDERDVAVFFCWRVRVSREDRVDRVGIDEADSG